MPLAWSVNHLDQVHGQLEQLCLHRVPWKLKFLVLEFLVEASHLRVVFQTVLHHEGYQQEYDLLNK